MDEQPATVEPQSGVSRETPTPDPARAALVSGWINRVKAAKDHFEYVFNRIKEDQQYAFAGASKEWVASGSYTVPIVQRHINLTVSQLYAKNPTATAERRKQVDYVLWDEKPESLQMAIQSVMLAMQAPTIDPMTGMPAPIDQNAVAIVTEVIEVQKRHQMLDKLGKTMEILFEHYLNEQDAGFKQSFKHLVRRTKVTGVGYVKLGFQRVMEKQPEVTARINDVATQIATMEATIADATDATIQTDDPRLEELRTMLADLQSQEDMIVREGPVLDFPRASEIIVDPKCRSLLGFIGADWIAHEFHMDPLEVQETYGIDISKSFKAYKPRRRDEDTAPPAASDETPTSPPAKSDVSGNACVWQIWSKKTGQKMTVIDGYPDFVEEPAAPKPRMERFWPVFTLTFNAIEHNDELYPPSDVHMLKHPQNEYNRARQGRRIHRRSNKPKYVVAKGAFEQTDKDQLSSDVDCAILELNGMRPEDDVNKKVQRLQTHPLDPALYETESEMLDVQRTVGGQEANFGGGSGGKMTATESSIAEQSRTVPVASNVDDLDDFLSELARSMGEVMLLEVNEETAKEIAGPGAVWPTLSRDQIVKELFLKVQAGSSGRPNVAAELANLERGMPFLIQLPGVPAEPLARKYGKLLDLGIEDLYVEGMPSITALNAMITRSAGQAATGDPKSDPGAQGDKGAQNEAKPDPGGQGAQPAYPAPAEAAPMMP